MLIGEPEPCQLHSTQIFISVLASNALQNMVVSSTSQQHVSEGEHMRIFEEPVPKINRILIIELSAALVKQ